MDLLERYTHAVRTYLPKSLSEAQQDDIVNELSENIRAQMEDREAELGRSLSAAEQEQILHQHGHPMIVAGRYQTNQDARVVFGRELIGPALFPLYLRVLWIILGISLAVSAAVVAALAVIGAPVTFAGVLNTIMLQIFIQFAVITAIFTAAQLYMLPTMQWSAQRLPAPQPARRNVPRVPRVESIGQIVGIIVLVFWLWFVFDQPSRLFGPALNAYHLGPVWQQVVLPVLLILSVSVAQAVVNLFRPEWVRLRRVVSVVTDIAALGVLVYLLRADEWVTSTSGNAPANINEFVYYGLLSSAVVFFIIIVIDAWKLIRDERRHRGLGSHEPQTA